MAETFFQRSLIYYQERHGGSGNSSRSSTVGSKKLIVRQAWGNMQSPYSESGDRQETVQGH